VSNTYDKCRCFVDYNSWRVAIGLVSQNNRYGCPFPDLNMDIGSNIC
jgi:hypothetical protein